MFKHGPNQLKWIAALESGKYKQTKGFLAASGYNCCLGVACEILGLQKTNSEVFGFVCSYMDASGSASCMAMPGQSYKELGLIGFGGPIMIEKLSNDLLKKSGDLTSLAAINDSVDNYDLVIRILKECPEAVFTESK